MFLSGALAACSIYGQAGTGINEIREAALTSLFAQPNYTCLETIDRGHEERGSLELEDRVRVEVVIVDGKEMFSWPGDSNFENAEILNLVRNGLFNSGNFGLYPRMLFFGTSAVFTFRGAAKIGDRSVVRHDFVVPQEASGFHVQHRDSGRGRGFPRLHLHGPRYSRIGAVDGDSRRDSTRDWDHGRARPSGLRARVLRRPYVSSAAGQRLTNCAARRHRSESRRVLKMSPIQW